MDNRRNGENQEPYFQSDLLPGHGRRLKQEDFEIKAVLGYKARLSNRKIGFLL